MWMGATEDATQPSSAVSFQQELPHRMQIPHLYDRIKLVCVTLILPLKTSSTPPHMHTHTQVLVSKLIASRIV